MSPPDTTSASLPAPDRATPGHSSRDAATPRRLQVLRVLGAGVGLAGGYSAAYFGTLSVFLKPVAQGFGWSLTQASAVAVLGQIGSAAGSPLVGRLLDRHGPLTVIPVSVLLFACAIAALPAVPGSLWMFAAMSLLAGFVSAATIPVGYLSVLSRSFDRRLGLAYGLAMLGLGAGVVLFPLAAQHWVGTLGWQAAYRSVAVAILVLGGVATVLLFWLGRGHEAGASMPSSGGVVGAGQAPGDAPAAGMSLREAAATGRFWLMAAVFFGVAASALGAVVHMVSLLVDRGITPSQAAQGASLIGIGVMVGRTITGALMDVLPARIVAAAAFLLGTAGLGLMLLVQTSSFALLALPAALFGLAIGAEGDIIPFFVRRYFGLRHLGTIYGVLLCVYSLGGVAGPVLYGFVHDRTGSYTLALGTGAAVCAACSLGVLGVGRYRYAAAGGADVVALERKERSHGA